MTTAQLIQLGASFFAVLAMSGLCRWFGLGRGVRIRDADHAKMIAFESIYGFMASDAIVDRAGYSALVKDIVGRHVLIRKHGAHFVARRVVPPVEGRLDQKLLTIDIGDPDFAPVTLNLGGAAQYWASGLRHIPVA
jgi:hypothetical protein